MLNHPFFYLLRTALWHGVLATILCILLGSATAAETERTRFATVQRLKGAVQASTEAGTSSRPLKVGDTVYVGEKVQSATAAEAVLRTDDAGVIAVRPNAAFVVERFNAKGRSDDAFGLRIVSGALRLITGWIGQRNPENYHVTTPTSLMGVRGTDYEPYVLSADLARQFRQNEGTYNRVYQGRTTMESHGVVLEVDAGQVGFAPAASGRKSRALMTALMPALLDKVPGFYVPGMFDEGLAAYAAAQLTSALAQNPELAALPTATVASAPDTPEASTVYASNQTTAPQQDSAECPFNTIGKNWLERLDAAIAQRDGQKFIEMFEASAAVTATVRQADGRETQLTFDRHALARSTFKALGQVSGFSSRRPVVQVSLAEGSTASQCKRLELQSVVIEEGQRKGQHYRLESLEHFTLEQHAGTWRAIAASTRQR